MRADWTEMRSSQGHLAFSTRPWFPQWKAALNIFRSALFTLLSSLQGFHLHKAGGERKWEYLCQKLQSSEQFIGWRKLSLSDANCSTVEFVWGTRKDVKGSKSTAGIRFIWTSFRLQLSLYLFIDYAVFILSHTGWHSFDNLSTTSLLSHISDTSSRVQTLRSVCSLHCAEPCGPLLTPTTSAQVV